MLVNQEEVTAEEPEVKLLRVTPEPEKLVCTAARGDYFHGFIGDIDFEELMEPVEGETIEDKMEKLISLLLKRGHYGPFEHVSMTFAIKGMSRACMAQITRHRMASFDIQSQRYVDFGDRDPSELCWPPSFLEETVKAREQGKHEIDLPQEDRIRKVFDHYAKAVDLYDELVDGGVPKEDARMVLPVGSKVNGTMTLNARSLMHILDMRGAGDAQWEVRSLSEALLNHALEEMPITFRLYKDEMFMRPNRLAP